MKKKRRVPGGPRFFRNSKDRLAGISKHPDVDPVHHHIWQKRFFLLGIMAIASFLRLWQLGVIPPGLTNDESGTIYSAYSIWTTGRDPGGTYLPLSVQLDNTFSPVAIYLTAPFVGIFGLQPTTARLASALAGIGSIYVLYLFTRKLTDNTAIALLSAAFLAITPWHILTTRMVDDPNFAMLFFLISLYAFMLSLKKGLLFTFISMVSAFIAFHTYHATKIYYVFFIPLLLVLYWSMLSKIQRAVIVISFILTILSFYAIQQSYGTVTRSSLLITNNLGEAAQLVNEERAKSTAPFVVRQIFSNKATVLGRWLSERYLEAFSTNFLFLYGETGALVSNFGAMVNQGAFYIFTFPFMLLGLAAIFPKGRHTAFLIAGLTLIAPLPSAFTSDKTYVFRSYMLLLALPLLAAYGAYSLWTAVGTLKKVKVLLFLILIVPVLWETVAFINHYFFRYPVYGAERWFTSSKDLALYLNRNRNSFDKVYVVQAGKMFLLQYGIYNQVKPNVMQTVWQNPAETTLDNMTFIGSCPKKLPEFPAGRVLLVLPRGCWNLMSAEPLETIVNRGEPLNPVWKLYAIKNGG